MTINKNGKLVDVTWLHKELWATVPRVSSISDKGNYILLLKSDGSEFNALETQAIQTAFDAHDAEARLNQEMTAKANRQNELAKNPSTLSTIERIRRLEIILGVN